MASTVGAYGGNVEIGDAQGGGARFGFRLPLSPDAPAHDYRVASRDDGPVAVRLANGLNA